MPGRVLFVCVLHSHQPVGNFDPVFEQVFQQSYARYVEVLEEFPEIPISLHNSGCLLEWLEGHHPEYLERLAAHAQGKRGPAWEMIGGGISEPILTMLPERDRLGQIRRMADYLEEQFGARPRGFWLPERVWEPALVKDLAAAGVEYLTLDDNHFKAAGLQEADLRGSFMTEDQGATLRVYPASERLRYLIPYALVEKVLEYLRGLVPAEGERVVCYADDGEKFGSWPETFKHVYTDGWLRRFLGALRQAQREGWLECITLAAAQDRAPAVGRIYLPENSYREMTEWVLPARTLAAYEAAVEKVRDDPRVKDILPLVKGGNWRSFKVKYGEAARMYAKMLEVSGKVAALPARAPEGEEARRALYRGQCNCAYWHGVFGGLYLPHLRNSVYTQLIRAEKLADKAAKTSAEARHEDLDFDGEREVKLANRELALYLHPARGGHLYELDFRAADFNVLDTFSRRYEAYHEKVARALSRAQAEAQSIHERVVTKEQGLEKLLQYDAYLRESLVDHLSPRPLTPQDFLSGAPPSDPGFRQGLYQAEMTPLAARGKKAAAPAVTLVRHAAWGACQVRIRKQVRLQPGGLFEIEYTVEHAGGEAREGRFAVEFNYNLLAGEAEDRYYCLEGEEPVARLGATADWGSHARVGLRDHYLNVALTLCASVPARVLVSPVRTVSQSEGGFESVYQSSCVALEWPLRLAPGPAFAVTLAQEVRRART